jgi:hypothetical protein
MKAYVRTLRTLQFAFIAGLTLFALIVTFLIKTGKINRGGGTAPAIPDMPDYFLYISLGLVAAIVLASAAVFNKQVERASQLGNTADKLNAYRNASIRRAFIPELAAILSIVITILTHELKYLCLAGLVILAFIAWIPTLDKVSTALNVSDSDINS